MGSEAIIATAATIAFFHTLVGVDHYLPFIAMGKARNWSLKRTLFWTTVCGLGHIGSSIALAGLAAGLGWAVGDIQAIDGVRGDLAAYALVAFGLGYLTLALRRRHRHHHNGNDQAGDDRGNATTLWALVIIFVLGPCEPLIPLMIAPGLTQDLTTTLVVIVVFSAITLSVMLSMVTVSYLGLSAIRLRRLEPWAHPLAGAALTLSGVLILAGL